MADKHRTVRRQLFPEKLWELVNKPGSGIQWSPDGKRIEVDRKQLEKFIGTKFRSQNFDSFIRQLHFYGFRKCGNSYHHEKFQRGQPEALLAMRRKYSNFPFNSHPNIQASAANKTSTASDGLPPISHEESHNHCYNNNTSSSGSDSLSVINGSNEQGEVAPPMFGTLTSFVQQQQLQATYPYTSQSIEHLITSTPTPSSSSSIVLNNNELKLSADTLAQQVALPVAAYVDTDHAIDYSKTRKTSPAKIHTRTAETTTAANSHNPASVHFADELGGKVGESSGLEIDDFVAKKSNTENMVIYSLQTDSKSNNIAQPIYGKTDDAFPSFSMIKATPTQAIVDKNSVSINLTEAMSDQRADAWPKTLVLNKFQVGGQTLLSAHFLYKLDSGSKP